MNFSLLLITSALRIYFRLTLRVDAPDIENAPAQGPLIIIANHTGQIEVPLLATLLQPRKITGWGKAEAFDNPFLRWVFGAWGVMPVRRGEADMHALKTALRAIEKGMIFGIAPEGTRNYTGKLKRALPGAVTLALHSDAPIVPIAHWGGENFMKNIKRFRQTDFHMRVGEPFKIDTHGIKVTGEIRQQIVDEMMVQIARLMPGEYRGEYAEMSGLPTQFIKHITL